MINVSSFSTSPLQTQLAVVCISRSESPGINENPNEQKLPRNKTLLFKTIIYAIDSKNDLLQQKLYMHK